jgi:hypothetical protein
MPVGGFLDSFPALVFIVAHVAFLAVGVWAMRRAAQSKLPFSSAFWLYIVSQVGFLAVFGGALTLRMGVLLEQTLILIFVILLVRKPASA